MKLKNESYKKVSYLSANESFKIDESTRKKMTKYIQEYKKKDHASHIAARVILK